MVSISDYITITQRDSARELYQLFQQDKPFNIPTGYDLLMEDLRFWKYSLNEFGDDFFDADMVDEICKVLDIDFEDVLPLD